ncbi:MAG: YdcF family protein, partial [Candidatus Omnitrophota bacterium]
ELYRDGYARKIMFSSGYAYVYNDSDNMRLMALSMGVSDADIILESEAGSAYENVRFSGKVFTEKGWNSILLVSSPYNMRRVSLVFKRLYGGLNVLYTPVPKSQFYDRRFGVNWAQIRAIAHEYLGIVYYWAKGYI